MADIKKIAKDLVNLSVKDVSELANILKDEYGIEPASFNNFIYFRWINFKVNNFSKSP